MTNEEIETEKAKIETLTHLQMAELWRFAAPGHPYFDESLPLWFYFKRRFDEFGGFNPQISKALGWEKKGTVA